MLCSHFHDLQRNQSQGINRIVLVLIVSNHGRTIEVCYDNHVDRGTFFECQKNFYNQHDEFSIASIRDHCIRWHCVITKDSITHLIMPPQREYLD